VIFLNKKLGSEYPFIVAEISCNHEGRITQAFELVEAAKTAGADAVKIQIYNPEDMTLNMDTAWFNIENSSWNARTLWELYTKTRTDYHIAFEIMRYANEVDIPCFASVFSREGLAWAEKQACPAYKIASFELTDLDLIKAVAETGKPVVISTGMASEAEIHVIDGHVPFDNLILMHCMSAYPTKLSQTNLWRIGWLKERFTPMVGFSDHTMGIAAGPLAVAAGAVMLEKHLCLRGTDPEDAKFSLYPDEFETYVKQCRQASEAYQPSECPDEASSHQFRRSIYITRDIQAGERFTRENTKVIRPAYGLHGHYYPKLLANNITAKIDLKAGEPLRMEHVEWQNLKN